VDNTELVAAYVGLLRHELKLPRGADALVELEARLAPPDRAQRPPSRAPGIARLAKALKRLRTGRAPACSIEEFAADLQFLRMFANDSETWTPAALDDLMANVITMPARKRSVSTDARSATEGSAKIIPLRRRRPPKEDG
jgi:hypothetical protein